MNFPLKAGIQQLCYLMADVGAPNTFVLKIDDAETDEVYSIHQIYEMKTKSPNQTYSVRFVERDGRVGDHEWITLIDDSTFSGFLEVLNDIVDKKIKRLASGIYKPIVFGGLFGIFCFLVEKHFKAHIPEYVLWIFFGAAIACMVKFVSRSTS